MKHLVPSPYVAVGHSVLYAFLNMHNDDALQSGAGRLLILQFCTPRPKIFYFLLNSHYIDSLCISQRKCVCYAFIIKPII